MKLAHYSDGRVAHVDAIADGRATVNIYASEADFWSSQAPVGSFQLAPTPCDYDTASEMLAQIAEGNLSQWVIDSLKAQRIAQINYEAGRRIESVWPLWAQSNAALGVYPESDAIACRAWIERHIDASNAATAQVQAATSAAEIDAVVVAWPEAA